MFGLGLIKPFDKALSILLSLKAQRPTCNYNSVLLWMYDCVQLDLLRDQVLYKARGTRYAALVVHV